MSDSILQKLGSFDQDIRFMGLNDLASTLTTGSKVALEPRIISAIVNCLGDAATDVQNQAVKLIGLVAASSHKVSLTLIQDILDQTASVPVKGIALKHVFQTGNLSRSVVDRNLPSWLQESKVFDTTEGVDALLELARLPSLLTSTTVALTQHFVRLLTSKNASLGTALPIVDALAVTIPHIPEETWNSDVRPTIVKNIHNQLFLGLVAKFVDSVPESWLVPEVSGSVIKLAHSKPVDSNDMNYWSSLLQTLTALAEKSVEFRNVYGGDLLTITENAIEYREYGDLDDEEAEDDSKKTDQNADTSDMMDDEFEYQDDDNSDWFDESSLIRQAATKLAAASHNAAASRVVLNALAKEQDETSRSSMYEALGSLYRKSREKKSLLSIKSLTTRSAPPSPSSTTQFVSMVESSVRKDLAKRRLNAADTAIKLVAEIDGRVSPQLVEDFSTSSKMIWTYKYLNFFKPQNTEEVAAAKRIISSVLTSTGLHDTTIIQALQLARDLKDIEALPTARSMKDTSLSLAVKEACLTAIPSLINSQDKYTTGELITEYLALVSDKRTNSSLVLAGLCGLKNLFDLFVQQNGSLFGESSSVFTALNSTLSQSLVTLASRGESSDSEPGDANAITDKPPQDKIVAVITDTLDLLYNLKDDCPAQVAESFSTIMNNPELISYVQRLILASDSLISQPRTLAWAVEAEALDTVVKAIRYQVDPSKSLREVLTRSASPEVHAAAASGLDGGWELLTEFYRFDDTEFSALNTQQLRVLLALAQRRCRWRWYSLAAIERNLTNETQAEVFGTITAVVSGDAKTDAEALIKLDRPLLVAAFTAYIRQLRDPSTIIEVMAAHPQLQIPQAAAVAIPNYLMFEKFAAKFSSEPKFVIDTIKLLQLPHDLSSVWPVLSKYSASENLDCNIQSEALSTLSWVIQTSNDVPRDKLEAILDQASTLLTADKTQVQTVQIGPFKHKVDPSAILRQTALETLYTCLVPNVKYVSLDLLQRVLAQITSQGIKDDEHDIKVMSYRLLNLLAEANPSAIKLFIPQIEVHMTEELNKKLKDSAVKQDVEKHAELSRVIAETQKKINRLV